MIKTNLPFSQLTRLETDRFCLDLVLSDAQCDELVELTGKNLLKGHLQGFYIERPENIDLDYARRDIEKQLQKNREDEQRNGVKEGADFQDLFFIVRDKIDCSLVGSCQIYGSANKCAEIGIFVDQALRGKAIGKEIVETLKQFIINHTIDTTGINWNCDRDNAGSVNLALKCGFVFKNDYELYEGRMSSAFHFAFENKNK